MTCKYPPPSVSDSDSALLSSELSLLSVCAHVSTQAHIQLVSLSSFSPPFSLAFLSSLLLPVPLHWHFLLSSKTATKIEVRRRNWQRTEEELFHLCYIYLRNLTQRTVVTWEGKQMHGKVVKWISFLTCRVVLMKNLLLSLSGMKSGYAFTEPPSVAMWR